MSIELKKVYRCDGRKCGHKEEATRGEEVPRGWCVVDSPSLYSEKKHFCIVCCAYIVDAMNLIGVKSDVIPDPMR